MALTQVTGARATYWMSTRPGGLPNGTPYTALVSDLAAGDFICGMRATVVSTGSTTSGNRTLTLNRLGITWTQTLVAASTLMIIRA
jgi:hypothetical protein